MKRHQKPLKPDSKSHHQIRKDDSKEKTSKILQKTGDKKKTDSTSQKEIAKHNKQRSESLHRRESVNLKEAIKKPQSIDRLHKSRESQSRDDVKAISTKTKLSSSNSDKNSVSASKLANSTSDRNKKGAHSKGFHEDNSQSIRSQKTHKTVTEKAKNAKPTKEKKSNKEIAKSFVKNSSEITNKSKIKKDSNQRKKEDLEKNDLDHKKSEEKFERPRTSTIHKGPPKHEDLNSTKTDEAYLKSHADFSDKRSSVKLSDEENASSYEEDFEEYDSDFEDSDSNSISESESDYSADESDKSSFVNEIKQNRVEDDIKLSQNNASLKINEDIKRKKPIEKSFLKMSDSSSLFNQNERNQSIQNNKEIKISRSFINFASALEQEEKKKYSNQVLKRASELLDIIVLDKVAYDLVDVPPMKYDIFIRTFGRKNFKQITVQTENCDHEETQTDFIEKYDKWTQNPPHDLLGYGGDNINTNDHKSQSWESFFNAHNRKLSSFLQNISNVIFTLLDENSSQYNKKNAKQIRKDMFYSDGYETLHPLSFLKNAPVVNISTCSIFNQYIISIHNDMIKLPYSNDFCQERGIICIWNLFHSQKPESVLIANSQPTCASFGPLHHDIVIAGMVDGAIMLWDLSELGYKHSQIEIDGEQIYLRSPTYNTAAILGSDSHFSCIVAVQTAYSQSSSKALNALHENGSAKNFHVLTLEDMGVLNIWVVIEVLKPDPSGLETDLGLAPGGQLRMVKSSSLYLNSLRSLLPEMKISIRTFDFCLVPNDSNEILITTDVGIILHVTRYNDNPEPRFYSGNFEYKSEIRCIDCSPHNKDLFLVGCSDGSARLYNINSASPLIVFPTAAEGQPLTLIQWSTIQPASFCILSLQSHLYLWNLLEDINKPIKSYHFEDTRITWLTFTPIENTINNFSHESFANMLIAKDNGEIEVHKINTHLNEDEYKKEIEFMKSL